MTAQSTPVAPSYQVTADLATVKTTNRNNPLVYVYEDGFLPANADPDHVKHLLTMGLIAEVTS